MKSTWEAAASFPSAYGSSPCDGGPSVGNKEKIASINTDSSKLIQKGNHEPGIAAASSPGPCEGRKGGGRKTSGKSKQK